MKTLIVEDEFTSRLLLQRCLGPFGEVHVAIDGSEALEAFRIALADGTPYNLVCLDIVMPGLDGNAVLNEFRKVEAAAGIPTLGGAKVMMTTGVRDPKQIIKSFGDGCEAYVTKPIEREKLLGEIRKLGLVGDEQ